MTTKHLHVLAVYPSEETGWCRLTVPRTCIFGTEDSVITEWDYGTWTQPAPATAIAIARKARETQGLDYKTGPAVVCEMDDDRTAIQINAMLELLYYENRMGDATLHFQDNEQTSHITEDHLRSNHILVAQYDIQAATRHALTLLGRARQDEAFAHELWPYPPSGSREIDI